MVETGEKAPEFTLPGTYQGEITSYTLSEHTADGPVLLGVYVFDFSPVCSTQMCQLSDMDWYQYKSNLSIFGVSTDGPYSHMEFATENDLNYPLLCDRDGEVLDKYGVLHQEKDGLRLVPKRSVFLIDEEQTIRYKWVADDNWEEDDFGLNPVQEAITHL